jgi:FkbM family methyltransferase
MPEDRKCRAAMRDLVFDIGMNVGEDTDFYLKKGFRVVAVEANPATCRNAAAKYSEAVAAGQLTILNRAISSSRGPTMLHLCTSNPAWSTVSPRLRDYWQARGAAFEDVEVPGLLPGDLVAAFGVPYYAKIDIEGSDLRCLDAFADAAAKPPYLSVEVDFYRLDELFARLGAMGYRRFALIGQLHVVEQRAPNPAREGRYVDDRFEIGSSGLFGRELPEPWHDEDATRRRCRHIVWEYRLAGALQKLGKLGGRGVDRAREKFLPLAGDWYDLHASLDEGACS